MVRLAQPVPDTWVALALAIVGAASPSLPPLGRAMPLSVLLWMRLSDSHSSVLSVVVFHCTSHTCTTVSPQGPASCSVTYMSPLSRS
jgi:hypothetical protein